MNRWLAIAMLVHAPAGSLLAQADTAQSQVSVRLLELSEPVAPILIGQVIAVEDGQPVQHAQVFLHGTDIGRMTAEDGSFELEAPGPGEWELEVRFIGFEPERIMLQLREGTLTHVLIGFRRSRPRLDHDPAFVIPVDTAGGAWHKRGEARPTHDRSSGGSGRAHLRPARLTPGLPVAGTSSEIVSASP
jgi:hypothetical protein